MLGSSSCRRRQRPDNFKCPSVLPSLGGCPASCPDTYRLTRDHRHVRNWARVEIIFLNLLCKNFFRLRTNFPNASLRPRANRALEDECLLSFLRESCALSRRAALQVVPVPQGFLASRGLRAAREGFDARGVADEGDHH